METSRSTKSPREGAVLPGQAPGGAVASHPG